MPGPVSTTAFGPRRSWLWTGTAALLALALLVGLLLRAAAHGGGSELWMIAFLAAAAVLLLVAEVVTVLQAVQAREAARAALVGLPPGHRVSGRIRIRGTGRPVVIDAVVVRPDGAVFTVLVDGSANPPAPQDPTDGLRKLLPQARNCAVMVERAAAAGVLPAELGLHGHVRAIPCVLAARRPLRAGAREGVLAFAAAEAVQALDGWSRRGGLAGLPGDGAR